MDVKRLVKVVGDMIDHDCKVIAGDTFMYHWGDNAIEININEGYLDNLGWKKFLKKEFDFDLNHENWFTLSILHELGHHYTLAYFDEDEVRKSQHACRKENEHYYEQVEMMATDWAVSYYRLSDMDAWNKEITECLQ